MSADDLAGFLLARIGEEEGTAQAAATRGTSWGCSFGGPVSWGEGHPGFDVIAGGKPILRSNPEYAGVAEADHIAYHDPARVLAECEAKRRIVEAETQIGALPEWTPDCGGDWCLSGGAINGEPGVGYFANYWPDNTVSVSVYRDGKRLAESGIVARGSRAECQAFAEQWVREHLPEASPVLRLLALPYADHPEYRPEWRP